ncbi:hypothetical protein KSF78_0004952 [Schistosoma japonicum]|nr:hypothetical protein KSF78_0004952 [Schistosoma japonicum]
MVINITCVRHFVYILISLFFSLLIVNYLFVFLYLRVLFNVKSSIVIVVLLLIFYFIITSQLDY